MSSNTFFIVYQSFGESSEVLVTTNEMESETIRMYFTEGGRDLEDYDRTEHADPCIPVRVTQLQVL